MGKAPSKKITLDQLRTMMADPKTTEKDLRPYFQRGDEHKPFSIRLELNPHTVETPPDTQEGRARSALTMNWANKWCRMDRHRRFEERINSDYKGPIIVSEGDSWFEYPLLLNDVIDDLLDDYAILSLDAAGDTLQNMMDEKEFVDAVKQTKASIMLFSGGGNDLLAGGHLAEHLRDYDPNLSAEQHLLPSFGHVLNEAMGWYDKLFHWLQSEAPDLTLIGHGYDRPIPANGPWLGQPMEKRGITDAALQVQIAAVMLDRFNMELSKLATGFSHVTILDNRGKVSKTEWYDELHPKDPGFARVAAEFKKAIEDVPSRARAKAAPAAKGKPAAGSRERPSKAAPRLQTAGGRTALSIHIGLNKVDPAQYEGWGGPLRSCEYDAQDMQAIAQQQGFDTKAFLTEKATSKNVIEAIKDAATHLNAGDILFLSYSGHGGTLPDFNGDEDDQQDETWCLYDRQLVDDELYLLWREFKPDVRILVLADSCHSGTSIRAANAETVKISVSVWPDAKPRMMPDDIAGRVYRAHRDAYDKILTVPVPGAQPSKQSLGRAITQPLSCTVRLISGCQDNQISADLPTNGAFTQSLLRVWNHGRFDGDYASFHNKIRQNMPATQVPNHWVVGQSNPVFDRQRPFTI